MTEFGYYECPFCGEPTMPSSAGNQSLCRPCTDAELAGRSPRTPAERQHDEQAAARARRAEEKASASRIYQAALARGEITPPERCEECGVEPGNGHQLHGHHPDYSRPLDVIFVCVGCHNRLHPRRAS